MKTKSQRLILVGMILALGVGAGAYGLAATSADTSPSEDLVEAIGIDGKEGFIKTSDMNQDLPQTPEEAIQSMNEPKVDKYINLYDSNENIIGQFLLESAEDSH